MREIKRYNSNPVNEIYETDDKKYVIFCNGDHENAYVINPDDISITDLLEIVRDWLIDAQIQKYDESKQYALARIEFALRSLTKRGWLE